MQISKSFGNNLRIVFLLDIFVLIIINAYYTFWQDNPAYILSYFIFDFWKLAYEPLIWVGIIGFLVLDILEKNFSYKKWLFIGLTIISAGSITYMMAYIFAIMISSAH